VQILASDMGEVRRADRLLLLSCQPPLVIVLSYDVPTALFDALLRLVILGALHDLAVTDSSHGYLCCLWCVRSSAAQLALHSSTSEHRLRKLFAVGLSPPMKKSTISVPLKTAEPGGHGAATAGEPVSPTRSHDQPPGESSEKKLTPDFRGGTRGRRAQSR